MEISIEAEAVFAHYSGLVLGAGAIYVFRGNTINTVLDATWSVRAHMMMVYI